jgi:hypothetical protein
LPRRGTGENATSSAGYDNSDLHCSPSRWKRSSSSTCCFSFQDLDLHLHVRVHIAAQVAVDQFQPAVG